MKSIKPVIYTLPSIIVTTLAISVCVATPLSASSLPTVVGNTISWSEAGWYQVQNANTYATICEGGMSCVVDPGQYTVINHTNQSRYDNIHVAGEAAGHAISDSHIVVSGNRISWPDNGWYQVQTTDDYRTLCEGGAFCDVEPGRYQVINLTTGKRYDSIIVESGHDPLTPSIEPVSEPILNAENSHAVIKQAFEVFTGEAYDLRLREFPYITSGQNPNCNSGSVHHRQDNISHYESTEFTFNVKNTFYNCDMFNENLSGTVSTHYDESNDNLLTHNFTDSFRIDISPDTYMTLGGEYRVECCDDVTSFKANGLNYFFTYTGGTLVVKNAQTHLRHEADGSFSMGGSFTMQPPVLNGKEVTVYTADSFTHADLNYGHGPAHGLVTYEFQEGVMYIVSDDSTIKFEIDPDSDSYANITLTTSEGTETRREDIASNWKSSLYFKIPASNYLIFDGQPSSEAPLITESNYHDWVSEAFKVFNGNYYRSTLLELPRYSDSYYMDSENARRLVTDYYVGLGTEITESCTSSGSAVFTPYRWGYNEVTTGFNFDFSNCHDGTKNFNGSIRRRNSGSYASVAATGFESSSATISTRFSGSASHQFGSGRVGTPRRSYSVNDVRYEYTSSTRSTLLEGSFSRYDLGGLDLRGYTGGFTHDSALTGNKRVSVGILSRLANDLRSDENPSGAFGYFRNGALKINVSSDNQLIIRANPANPDYVRVELYTNGVLDVFETHWADVLRGL